MQMIIETTIDGRYSRREKHFPSELDFLRALDRVEARASDRRYEVARFDTEVIVVGRNGVQSFRA